MIDFRRRGFLLKQEKGCWKYGIFSRPFDAFKWKTTLAVPVLLGNAANIQPGH